MSTASLLRAAARQRRILLMVGVLTLGFGLTVALALQAHRSARSHRSTVERALADYAAFGALQFAVHAKEGIYSRSTGYLFRPVDPAVGMSGNDAARAAHPKTCAHGTAKGPRFFFSLDLATREFAKARGCVGDDVRAWLRDTLATHARAKFDRRWEHADFIALVAGEPWMVVYSVRFDRDERPVSAFGFATPFREFARPVFADVMKYYHLLPPTLVGRTPNDSLVSVSVADARGTLFESGPRYDSPYRGVYAQPKVGGFTVHLTIRPEVAEKLVIGGLPRSRLPQTLGLLALAGALTLAALYQLRREAALARLRSDFISSISHELRTPLAQVRMFAETLLLDRVRSDAERRRSLQIIDQEARRLTHLVENVLQFSRNERSVARLSPELTDVGAEVREVLEAFAPIAAARGVRLVTALGDGCGVEVDRAALRQVLLNFLDNAVKYGPTGQTVTVGAHCAGRMVQLWVDDEGPGIPPRDRARVWEPFQRLDRDAGSAVAGSGIGLSVVRDLVTMHGGHSRVSDAPGGGARFLIELPGVEPTSSPATPPGSDPSAIRAPADDRTSYRRAGV